MDGLNKALFQFFEIHSMTSKLFSLFNQGYCVNNDLNKNQSAEDSFKYLETYLWREMRAKLCLPFVCQKGQVSQSI